MRDLYRMSESRGKEAAGVAALSSERIVVAKTANTASQLIRSSKYSQIVNDTLEMAASAPVALVGHSRLVTNGAQEVYGNNQPVARDNVVAVHNGIITNVEQLWNDSPGLERHHEIDSEIIPAMIGDALQNAESIDVATRRLFRSMEGGASIAVMFQSQQTLLLATNSGSIYYAQEPESGLFLFASEHYILREVQERTKLPEALKACKPRQLQAGAACLVDLATGELQAFGLFDDEPVNEFVPKSNALTRRLVDSGKDISPQFAALRRSSAVVSSKAPADSYPKTRDAIGHLKRCTRCVLPETMPYIEFDGDGVCNYCRNYTPIELLGHDALRDRLEPFRRKDGGPECLITFSGGRDSSYCLHYIKRELGIHPITYTYDWGMVTDLARRNQMRMCGKLGVEHILVSAKIASKRANIRANVSAWLAKPDLGTVPLFMAGDKQYFYYANKISQQTGCQQIVIGTNLLETTRFKSGFCGIRPRFGTAHPYALTMTQKLQMAGYYSGRALANLRYFNASLIDSIAGFASYYFIPHEHLNMYQYVPWSEEEVDQILIDEYNWETATDTRSTWRIGDGTAAFYNYIYLTLAGFSENDTFRSNQIREGMIDRDEALRMIDQDNRPRYESMQWYCDAIGIDFAAAIKSIDSAPRLYEH